MPKRFDVKKLHIILFEIPIIGQLETLFKRTGLYESLQYRFRRGEPRKLRDIYDGQIYKDLSNKDILSSPDAISFLINTDGARCQYGLFI